MLSLAGLPVCFKKYHKPCTCERNSKLQRPSSGSAAHPAASLQSPPRQWNTALAWSLPCVRLVSGLSGNGDSDRSSWSPVALALQCMLNTAEVLGMDIGPTLSMGAFIGTCHDLHKLHMQPELKTVAPAIHCKKSKAGKGLELHDHPEKRCCDRHRPGRPGCSIFYFAKTTNSSIRSKTASPGQ